MGSDGLAPRSRPNCSIPPLPQMLVDQVRRERNRSLHVKSMRMSPLAAMVLVLAVIGVRSHLGQMDDHEAVGLSVAGDRDNLQRRSYLVPPPLGRV